MFAFHFCPSGKKAELVSVRVFEPFFNPNDLLDEEGKLPGEDLERHLPHEGWDTSGAGQEKHLPHGGDEDIYVDPGQEQHLPHEAWHVVQQRRIRPRPIRLDD